MSDKHRHQWWCGGLEPCACTEGWKAAEAERLAQPRSVRDRRALPPDGPDIGADVPGGGAI